MGTEPLQGCAGWPAVREVVEVSAVWVVLFHEDQASLLASGPGSRLEPSRGG